MNTLCTLLATALFSSAADTNLLTFTNRAGEVLRNVRVTGADASGLFVWTTNGAGHKLLFTDAPEFLRAKYNYDSARAAAHSAAQADDKRRYELNSARELVQITALQKAEAELKTKRDAFLKSCSRIKGVVFQRKDGLLLVDNRWRVAGGALQYPDEPIIFMLAVRNFPGYDKLQTGDAVDFYAVEKGRKDYQNLFGDNRPCLEFDYTLPAEWAHDPLVLKAFHR